MHFQTEHLGWRTDDFLVVASNGTGRQRKLAGQVKRSFKLSAGDEETAKAVTDFWQDFRAGSPFAPDSDRLLLVVLRGTNTLLEHFAGLLDSARAAADGEDFERRLGTKGFLSEKAIGYCDTLREIVEATEGQKPSIAQMWPFLKVLHVLSLDLHTATRQHEALMRSMLAHAACGSDPLSTAGAAWQTLLDIASTGMEGARSFRRDDLPEELRQRLVSIGAREKSALQALKDHTAPIVRGIRSTIGADLHLPRAALVERVLSELSSHQVVLLSGPAGNGKSAVAKNAMAALGENHFAFAFRAEEFAQSHFDITLSNGQVPANTEALKAILAAQGRKVVLIESAERLLERVPRDALSDLLGMAALDQSLRIVLTCRDYSTDLVRESFLAAARLDHVVITIPELTEGELHEVAARFPSLARPLGSPALRRILGNPYFLDKALQIAWLKEESLPSSERELRSLFWRQIVRSSATTSGLPAGQRERLLEEVAIRRARALSPYVGISDLDGSVAESLRRDSLLAASQQSPDQVAPAHDVLEDWAILQWIELQYRETQGSFVEFSKAIGVHPAIRRAYRKWMSELVDSAPSIADDLFEAGMIAEGASAQFMDDTLVSLLRAPSFATLLPRHVDQLLANSKRLLKRVVHLTRVACVSPPDWLSGIEGQGSVFNVPNGPSWGPIMRLLADHVNEFGPADRALLLGFLEDWAKGVSLWVPDPDGAEAAAAIGHALLPHFDVYYARDAGQRVLKVLAKIPTAAQGRFEALLLGTDKEGERNHASETFRDLILNGMDGAAAARDLPDLIVFAAESHFLCTEEDLKGAWNSGYDLGLELDFGLKDNVRRDYFPPSAYRGPWLPLLRHHPTIGVPFLTRVFNHTADWYENPRFQPRIEPPFPIELVFNDGPSSRQVANPRMWNWYRGTSVGPYVLQSLLMTLEHWLFERAAANPSQLDHDLVYILRESKSAALTAVVASVATAYARHSGEALLVLLSSPECILLDRQRMVNEVQVTTDMLSGMMARTTAENRIYTDERKKADSRPHRRRDLESAIMAAQFGPFASRVQGMIDKHRTSLPPIASQSDEDRVWRLALHRMDLRQYSTTEIAAPVADEDAERRGESSTGWVRYDLTEPEPDVKEMVTRTAERHSHIEVRLGLLNWAMAAFRGERVSESVRAAWREQLRLARAEAVVQRVDDESGLGRGGPGVVAAVCVRDHWDEMDDDERHWCIKRICAEIGQDADEWDDHLRMQRYGMAADRACASVVFLLHGRVIPDDLQEVVKATLVLALTHPIDEVRWHGVWGVARDLWPRDRALAVQCVNAIAVTATLVDRQRAMSVDRSRDEYLKAEKAAAGEVRGRFWSEGGIPSDACANLDLSTWAGAEANARIVGILSYVPSEPLSVMVFARAVQRIVEVWTDHAKPHRGIESRHYENEAAILRHLQRFVLGAGDSAIVTLQPMLDAVDEHPREVYTFINGLVEVEDSSPSTTQFWRLWQLFADRVLLAPWLKHLDREHPMGEEVIGALFFALPWTDGVRHWKSLEGHAQVVDDLFLALPGCAVVMNDYVRFLYHIGEKSLPRAFSHIEQQLKTGQTSRMLAKGDTVFMLEVLLQRHVYGRPLALKSSAGLRDTVLALLDILVENGSSAAFRMRDDFVTPLAPA